MISMSKQKVYNYEVYTLIYGDVESQEPLQSVDIRFTTWDLLHFMRWLYEMYDRRLIKPMYIRETRDGHCVLFEQVGLEDFSYYNQSYLIHRVYNKLEDVEKIVDIFNKYY